MKTKIVYHCEYLVPHELLSVSDSIGTEMHICRDWQSAIMQTCEKVYTIFGPISVIAILSARGIFSDFYDYPELVACGFGHRTRRPHIPLFPSTGDLRTCKRRSNRSSVAGPNSSRPVDRFVSAGVHGTRGLTSARHF